MPVLLILLLLLCLPVQLVAQVFPPVGGRPGSALPPTGSTCVDEVGIGLSPLGVLICGPVLPSMAPALVAAGVDVTALGQVIGTHFLTPLPVSQGGLGLTGGNPGGVLYFSAPGSLASSATFPINAPLIGGGAGQPPVAGTLSGTTRQLASVLGTLTPQKQLTFDANGNVIASEFDVGTLNMPLPLPVPQGGTGLDSGIPGGVLYFTTGATMASSPTMPLDAPLFGGGNGQAPVAGTRTGTTREVATATGAHTTLKQLMFDASGNIIASAADIGSPVPLPLLVSQGGTGLTSGTSGGVLYFQTPGILASSPPLAVNEPLFGGGAGQPPVPGSRSGTTTQVGTVTGAHTSQKQLMFDANGNIVASAVDIGGGGLTLPVPVAQGGTGLTSGTSGGLLYFQSPGVLASSLVLPIDAPLFGGGPSQPPVPGTRSGTTTQVGTVTGAHTSQKQLMFDGSGNIVASSVDIGSSGLSLPIPVAQGGTGLTSGASGGLLYFQTPGVLASSQVLPMGLPLFGGGPSQPPVPGTRTGTTLEVATATGAHTTLKQLMFDLSGNIVASAVDIGGSSMEVPLPVPQGGTGLLSGTPGSLLYFATSTTLAPTASFAANAPMFSGGAGQPPVTGTRSGTTTQVATVTGAHTSQKQLMFDGSGNIVASAFEVGSDLTLPIPVPQGGTGLTSGTSGGVLFFATTATLASTATLPLNAPLLGGGAGAGPVVGTRSGTTTELASVTGTHTTLKQLMFDVNGNIVASGADIGGTGAGTGGAVSSVFGRTGAVTAQTGDYSAAQVTNAANLTLANVWPHTGGQSMPALILTGSSSGALTLRAAPAGSPSVLIFPAGTMDLSVTGGVGHVVQQRTTGAALTVGPLAFTDLSGIATVCTITSVCTGYQAALGFTPENVTNKSNVALDSSTTRYPTNNAAKNYIDGGLATKQALLGFTPENVTNKSNVALDSSTTLYPTNNAAKNYIDGGLATKQALLGFTPENVTNKSNATLDSSTTLYPTNNAAKNYIDGGLATKQALLGFTPENVANKSNVALDSSTTLYPTNNAAKNYIDGGLATKQALLGFTPENVANKSNVALDSSTTLYPTNNAAKNYIDDGLATKQATLVPPAANQAQVSTTTGVLAWVTLPGCPLAFNTTTHLFECAPAVSFAMLTTGTNTTAALAVGSGSTLGAIGTGQINATSVPGTGVTSPISGAMIPSLDTLTTGLTPLRCVQTDASGFFVTAAGLCGSGSGGSGTGGSFSDLTGGTNTTAAMILSGEASLSAESGGFIRATSMPGEGLSSPVPDTMIPPLNSLDTGLLPLRCVETDATGKFVSASAVCGAGGGAGGTWGTIGGTLSNQTDLQNALNAKVPTSRTVNGHPLTSDIAITAADVGLGNVSNMTDAQRNSQTAKLTNKQVVPRVQLLTVGVPSANHVQPNADNTDVGYNYTFSAPLTIDTPIFTVTPDPQQLLVLEFATGAPQPLIWASGYSNECGLLLPTSTTGVVAGQQVYNRFLYRFSPTSTKWCLIASTKADSVRVTTLATATTFTCPADNSDLCEMANTQTAGTGIAVSSPGGTPSNGQRLSMAFKCQNAQAMDWVTAGVFLDSANYTFPTTCAADTSRWTVSVDLRYSSVLSKWQLVRGVPAGATLPATVVHTNQANTYGAFAQNFAAATSLTLPSSAGAAPTAAGQIAYDTTKEVPVFGENGLLSSALTRTLFMADNGSSNNGGSGDVGHTGTTVTLPANYLLQHRALRICVLWRYTTIGSPPTLQLKMQLGGVQIYASGAATTPGVHTNWTFGMCHLFVTKDAVGGAAATYTAPLSIQDALIGSGANANGTPQPVNLPTNTPLPLTLISRWSAATAGNIITPDLLTVEALN